MGGGGMGLLGGLLGGFSGSSQPSVISNRQSASTPAVSSSLSDFGIPETWAHIETQFGAFPLSEVSLMTDEERQRFLPATRTFISVLEKDTIDPSELTNLIPDNLLSQFSGGLGGLGGLGR